MKYIAYMPAASELFYNRLPVNEIQLSELFLEEHLFFPIPPDWYVVITDIKDSTGVVQRGRHETVNLIATGSIVAVLNIAYKAGITVPFFFGGDGASFIIPASLLPDTIHALRQHHDQTQRNFQLDIRVGFVPVSDIYSNKEELRITKLKSTPLFIIPVVLGNGLAYAERKVKGKDYILPVITPTSIELDLQGMQCRWDLVKPPVDNDEVVSLIVLAGPGIRQAAAFNKVIGLLDKIYGDTATRQPITANRLKLKATLQRIGLEMKARMGKFNFFYALRSWLTSTLGVFYFRTKTGRQYLDRLIEMSDTLVLDGRINTVITGTPAQRELLESALDRLEADGEILYGISTSAESVMSCYVRDLKDGHVHFVDGAEGGYTRAAITLKQKISAKLSS